MIQISFLCGERKAKVEIDWIEQWIDMREEREVDHVVRHEEIGINIVHQGIRRNQNAIDGPPVVVPNAVENLHHENQRYQLIKRLQVRKRRKRNEDND